MLGPTHRAFGALCGAFVATAQGAPFATVAMTALVATSTAHGWSSPDVDQTKPWVTVARALPRPLRSLMAHRRISHWWGVPVAAWWLITQMDPAVQWPFLALLIGWVSHLLGDAIFGKIPLLPWGGPCVGLGLDTGGFLETGRSPRGRRLIPFGPTQLALAGLLLWVLMHPLMP